MDYCTGWFEGWWQACCQAHDAAYDMQVARSAADQALAACVSSSLPAVAADHPILAGALMAVSAVTGCAMFAAVRVFGGPFYRRAGRNKSSSKDGRNA